MLIATNRINKNLTGKYLLFNFDLNIGMNINYVNQQSG